jgi:hypothetical protein
MRLFLATLVMALMLGATAVAQSGDMRAPDQQDAGRQQPAVTTDLRAPDQQVAPTQAPAASTDLRAPDQQVGPSPKPVAPIDLRAPDQQVGPTPNSPPATPISDDGPGAIVFVLIGLAAAMVLLAGGYLGVRYRHRVAIADDLALE